MIILLFFFLVCKSVGVKKNHAVSVYSSKFGTLVRFLVCMHVNLCQVSTIANLAYLRGCSSVVPETLTKVEVHVIKTFGDICHVIIRVATSAQLKVRFKDQYAGQSCQYINIEAIVRSLEAS